LVYKRFGIDYFWEFNLSFYWIDFEERLEQADILETVRGTPSQQKAVKEEENKIKETEETPKPLVQQVWN